MLDFGLAKLTGSGDEKVSHKTRTGSVMGTPYYMAPEQCEGKASIDHRADIYSLGVILFEMLTGKVPFGGEGYGEIIVKHITMPAPSARALVPELSPAIDADPVPRAWPRTATSASRPWPSSATRCWIPRRYAAAAPSAGIPRRPMPASSSAQRSAMSMSRAERERASQYLSAGCGDRAAARRARRRRSARRWARSSTRCPARSNRGKTIAIALVVAAGRRRGLFVLKANKAKTAAAQRRRSPRRRTPATVRVNFTLGPGRRADRARRHRQGAGRDAAVDRDSLQRHRGRVRVQEGGLREQGRLRRPQHALAAVRDAAAGGQGGAQARAGGRRRAAARRTPTPRTAAPRSRKKKPQARACRSSTTTPSSNRRSSRDVGWPLEVRGDALRARDRSADSRTRATRRRGCGRRSWPRRGTRRPA